MNMPYSAKPDKKRKLPDVLTPEEAADYLRVDRETIYRRLRAGQLPGNKVGGQWRLLRQELIQFLKGPSAQ